MVPIRSPGEFVYDHPFQWGSKRTGPDLARVGAEYSDDWHRVHLNNPRDVVPESNMPGYPWLAKTPADADTIQAKMKTLRTLGLPYTDEEIAAGAGGTEGQDRAGRAGRVPAGHGRAHAEREVAMEHQDFLS